MKQLNVLVCIHGLSEPRGLVYSCFLPGFLEFAVCLFDRRLRVLELAASAR